MVGESGKTQTYEDRILEKRLKAKREPLRMSTDHERTLAAKRKEAHWDARQALKQA